MQEAGSDAVLAEGAAEITSAGKNGAGHSAGIIQKRCLNKSVNLHVVPPFLHPNEIHMYKKSYLGYNQKYLITFWSVCP